MVITFMIYIIMQGVVIAILILSERDPKEKAVQYLMKTYGLSHEEATEEFEIFKGYERRNDVQVPIDEYRVNKK